MQIQMLDGASAAPIVEPHYRRNGFPDVKIRSSDTLFIATNDAKKVLACLRFCVEENVPLLRTMAVDEPERRKGAGTALLDHVKNYLEENEIRKVHLICSKRLNSFYARIGFEKIHFAETPLFLRERMRKYDPSFAKITCMKRP